MSDTKPSEVAAEAPKLDTPIGNEAVAAPTETPAAESTQAETAAPTTTDAELPKEQKVGPEEVAVEAKPITEGILGYKAPGLISSLRFSKRFFWFGDEAIVPEKLDHYLREEKSEIAHHNAAWSSQTGKGLLYFAKRTEDKAHPTGIFNLSDVYDITKEATKEFSFRLHGHKYLFEASSTADRDGWLVALQSKAEEAKGLAEGVVGSSGYKEHKEKLSKPAVAAPVVAATSTKREKTPDARKERSASRKRASVFGSLLNKKEEHEEKKEVKKEEKSDAKAETEESKTEAGAPAAEGLDAPAVAARVVGEPVVAPEGAPATAEVTEPTTNAAEPSVPEPATTAPAETTAKTETAPKPHKRSSIFGSLFKKDVTSPTEEKKEIAPAVPAKDSEEPTGTTAAAPESASEPVATEEGATAATPAVTASTPAAPATSTTPAETQKEKRRTSSFFGTLGSKKEKKAEGETSDGEAKQKSPTSKLGGLFRKPSRAVKSESEAKDSAHTPATTETAAADKSAEVPTTEAPAVTEKPEATNDVAPQPAVSAQNTAAHEVQAAA